jgi:succinate dehydrogenase / fumarate reductase cytochrome b subunit
VSTTATTALDHTVPLLGGRNHFLIRRLHSLTGIVFGGYLIVHLLVNATIAQGGVVYQQQVDKIHSLPFLPVIEWTFIYLPILFHTVYGVWIILTGQPNVANYPYGKNWAYVAQRVSAVIIVLFMLFHVLALKYGLFGNNLSFDPHSALSTVKTHFDTSFFITWILYPLGILASCFHLANGFWAGAITWGLTISAGAQRRWGYVCAALFVLLFIAGMTALISGAALDASDVIRTEMVTGHGA